MVSDPQIGDLVGGSWLFFTILNLNQVGDHGYFPKDVFFKCAKLLNSDIHQIRHLAESIMTWYNNFTIFY
jgi:hypothetical protein